MFYLEEDGLTGSLCALPLSVHGSASAQMQMVNISKIGKQVCTLTFIQIVL